MGTGHSTSAVTSSSRVSSMSGSRDDAGFDERATFAEVGDHLRCAQLPPVALRRGEGDGTGCVKTMAHGHAIGGQTQYVGGHHVLAEQQHGGAHGPHELGIARPPAHALGDGQSGDRLIHDVTEEGRGGCAGFRTTKCQPRALVGNQPLERRHLDTAALGKSVGCRRGGAGRIEGSAHGWSTTLDAAILRGFGAIDDTHREPPRRREPLRCAVDDAGRVQAFEHALLEGSRQGRERPGREFLRPQLEEQVARHQTASTAD
jgi:hypothetical protein